MRVLVTGGLGFVGRAVAVDLVEAGHQVDVLSRGRPGVKPPAGAELVEGELGDPALVTSVVADGRYDGICHLAAATRTRDAAADPLPYWQVNLGGTVNLLAAAQAAGRTPRFVLASTSVVYGPHQTGRLHEELPTQPEGPYACSKAAAEQAVRDVASSGALTAVVLRIFNVAGAVAGQADTDPTRIIPNVLRAARGELPHVSVNGDGSAVREYAHVLDVARAFRLALAAEVTGHATYNVGTGTGVSVSDVIKVAGQVTGRVIPVEHRPARPEPHTLVCDPTRITTDLGWQPTHSTLSEIIASAAAAGSYQTRQNGWPTGSA